VDKNKKTVVEENINSNDLSILFSLGKYTDLKLIGEGGQAAVYSAKDSTLGDRLVALKVLKIGDQAPKENIDRFKREIHLQAKLDIPGCVKVYECGVYQIYSEMKSILQLVSQLSKELQR
jgi:serine/threonine protein kinase